VIAHDPEGNFDLQALIAQAQAWSGLEGLDLAKVVTRTANEDWEGSVWTLGQGYGRPDSDPRPMWWRSTMARRTTSSAIW
jgi:carbamoyl-phosphate synthase small subunit